MTGFADRVAAEATNVRPVRALLVVLARLFWLLGVVIGAVIVAVVWSVAAVKVGIADVRARADRPLPVPDVAPDEAS